ncbi:hypothetical protein [Mycolicibacterium septicum]|uniref:hypothetical protein n=1 Tax=Mycolicibacterium septicum TaxID=98668 RepID=UPI004035895D
MLREVKVPENMAISKQLVDHLLSNAENGVSDGDSLANIDKVLSLMALSQVEVINVFGQQEAKVRKLTDAMKNFGKPRKDG